MDRLKNKVDIVEDRFSKLGDKAEEITQISAQEGKDEEQGN